MVIYTIGDKRLYEQYFHDHAPNPTYKAIGGSVWNNRHDAQYRAKLNSPYYVVYTLWGDWDVDTRPTSHSWNELTRDLIILESLQSREVVFPTDLVEYLKTKGYVVKKAKRGWACATPSGYSILRGWAKSESEGWKHCWNHCWNHMIREARW